jgi:pimeloyl-ACP methyl ester carboxylesterase
MKESALWRDPALGVAHELKLPQGRLRYFEAGTGSPIVFVHGLLVNANLWRKVLRTPGASRAARTPHIHVCLRVHSRPRGAARTSHCHGLDR